MHDQLAKGRLRHQSRATLRIGLTPLLLLVLGALMLPLAGCGAGEDVASKPATQILAASANAARKAGSVHVRSELKLGKTPASVELQIAGEQGGLARSSLGASHGEVIRVGNTVYVKVGPVLAERIAKTTGTDVPVGSWLQAPVSNTQVASSAFLTEPDGEVIYLLKAPTISLMKGPIVTIDGHKTIELKTKGKLYSGAIYVAATGTPYPIKIVKHGRETGQVTFSGWNDPVKLAAPAHAIDISQLEHVKGG